MDIRMLVNIRAQVNIAMRLAEIKNARFSLLSSNS